MKVTLIYLGRRGGGATYSLEIAKKLAGKTDLLAVVSSQAENLAYWKEIKGRLYEMNTYSNAPEFVLSSLDYKKFSAFYREIKQFSPDVIYYPMFHYWIPLINILFPDIPKVFTLHDPLLHKGESSFVVEFLQNLSLRKADRVIILNQFSKEIVSRKINPKNIDIIPHGIFDYYLKKPNEKRSPSPTILFFGRILEYKGLGVLLKAFPLIKEKVPAAKLIIAGSGDLNPYKKSLKDLNDVIMENKWIPDQKVENYFLQSNILICPYTDVSQSGIIPLAYAFKMPVVASKIGALKEQIEHRKTGLLVPPNNPEKLAEAAIYLLKNSAERIKMGEEGFEKANREWNWEKISEKVLESLKKAKQTRHE